MLEGTDLMSAYQSMSPQEYYQKDEYEPPQQQKPEPPIKQDNNMGMINKQFENEQKMALLVAELKKKKAAAAVHETNEPSYFDKLFGKKKELYRILQLSLMITLGISIHFLIDHYITKYLADNEMSFERQFIIRLMYPLAVLFIIWNFRVFVK